MDFSSTKKIESKAIPGVAFTIEVIGEAKRNRITSKLAPDMFRLRELQADIESVELPKTNDGDIDMKADIDPAVSARIYNLSDEIDRIALGKMDPEYFRAGFVSVESLDPADPITLNGVPFTTETFLESGPRDLYREIVIAIRAEAGMSVVEQSNLESPTTSAAPVGGQTSDTIAAAVETSGST